MAEPGDPKAPDPTAPEPAKVPEAAPPATPSIPHDLDDAVGFASPAALQGQPRQVVQPAPSPPAPVMEAAPTQPDPTPTPAPLSAEPAPIIAAPAAPSLRPPEPSIAPRPIRPSPAADPLPAANPLPEWARETVAPPRQHGAPRERPTDVEGSMGLYAVYSLILFAVPTLGVSALIALLAVTGRAGPTGAVAASHFVYQQRTLWAGAVAALLGAILIAVGLGVFVLFVLALWLILRGAAGVLKLKAGRPIANPRAWLF